MTKELPKTALEYVLQSLIPFTEANIKLSFKPGLFFNDLEKISHMRRSALQNAYYRGYKHDLIELNEFGMPTLTKKGLRRIKRFHAKHLGLSARLMVIFDIPETESWKRQHLRRLLRELHFTQVQKSVWTSEFDYRDILEAEVNDLSLQDYVQTYEALKI